MSFATHRCQGEGTPASGGATQGSTRVGQETELRETEARASIVVSAGMGGQVSRLV